MDSEHRAGLMMALAGFALFSIGDATTKSMAGLWSPLAVAALRFSMGALALGAFLLAKEGPRAFVPSHPWLQLARGVSLGLATTGFFWGVFLLPLTVAVSISFVAPAFAALLSGPLLGERVRPATCIAVAIAFAGVLVVLRPNVIELGWGALLPLLTALGMALLVICNRASAGQGSVLSMQFFVAAGAATMLVTVAAIGALSGFPILQLGGLPPWSVVARCALVAVTGTSGHWLIYLGTMRAGASAIAPMTYIQLITASALGWAAFGNVPDLPTVGGALVIVAAGLILWLDGRALASARGER
jgi:drug/metabolite transporter (DMT)-like permease